MRFIDTQNDFQNIGNGLSVAAGFMPLHGYGVVVDLSAVKSETTWFVIAKYRLGESGTVESRVALKGVKRYQAANVALYELRKKIVN